MKTNNLKLIMSNTISSDEVVKAAVDIMLRRTPDGDYVNEYLNNMESVLSLSDSAKNQPLDCLLDSMETYLRISLKYAIQDTVDKFIHSHVKPPEKCCE